MFTTSDSGRGVSRTPSNGNEPPRVRQPVRLLLVDPLPVVRRGLECVLQQHPDLDLVGSSSDHSLIGHLVEELLPDIVLLDIVARSPRAATPHVRFDLVRKIHRKLPRGRCLLFTAFHPRHLVDMALAERVAGIYSKLDNVDALPDAIRGVADDPHAIRLSPAVEKVRRQRQHAHGEDVAALSQITARESEILELVLRGQDTVTIARNLGISPRTVGTHRSRILRKTKARSFLELAASMERLTALGS